MKRRMAVWAMAAAVVAFAGAGAAVAESVEQLLAAGRLHEAAAACKAEEASLGTTAEAGNHWVALAAAMWNAGEREGAGMILERLSAEEWPVEVRVLAAELSEECDAQWSAMSEGGGATNAWLLEYYGKPFVFTNEEDIVFSRGYRAAGEEPNVVPKGTKITVVPPGYLGATEETAAGATEKAPLGQRIAERLQAKGWPVEGAIVAI